MSSCHLICSSAYTSFDKFNLLPFTHFSIWLQHFFVFLFFSQSFFPLETQSLLLPILLKACELAYQYLPDKDITQRHGERKMSLLKKFKFRKKMFHHPENRNSFFWECKKLDCGIRLTRIEVDNAFCLSKILILQTELILGFSQS